MAHELLSIELKNDLSEIAKLVDALQECQSRHGLPSSTVSAVTLALEEIITNTISYGYEDDSQHGISVRVTLDAGDLMATVEDDGRAYDPLEADAPDVHAPIELRRVGGLGILLVRRLMDHVAYRRSGDKNVLVVRRSVTRER
jgi:anti-sigma regulatory factor (Ser/Thr protein kinase)